MGDSRLLLAGLIVLLPLSSAHADKLAWIRVAEDGKSFVRAGTDQTFTPWGFNYDRDYKSRLLEDYWEAEWETVAGDFQEMKKLGANVIRIHLQLGKFMRTAEQPNEKALNRLDKLVALAENTGLYLDLTGLGCYHKKDVPAWYDRLTEQERWDVQARFWAAIARRCAGSPAIFCYDLMNEPVVPGGRRKDGDWLGPAFAGKHYVQVIALDQRKRPRPAIARAWIQHLSKAIRQHDKRHLITVGLVDWSLDRKGLTSGFVPQEVVKDVDFLCVHLYPKAGKVAEAIETLRGFAVGKPVVIEETFPLQCSLEEFEQFVKQSQQFAAGWIGFYWGQTLAELRQADTFPGALMVGWLEFFEKNAKTMAK